jgi:hypothetical protein
MSKNEISTLILRFRDLVTDHGQTVAKHQEIIKTKGHVWWGWWRKQDETIPDDAFRHIAQLATKGLKLYLMDSGQDLLFEVNCTDVRWDSKHIEISTPNVNETPEYYNQKPLMAWFQFIEIVPLEDPQATLQQFSYLQVDDFFKDKTSNYLPFYGKRVYSVKELRLQDRTIWFLRGVRDGDPINEITLLNAREAAPVHFSPQYFPSNGNTLLWLSDLHFSIVFDDQGKPTENHHAFPYKPTGNRVDLGERLESSFKDEFPNMAGVIMSGDLTWKASPDEFALARNFIKRLHVWFTLRSDQIGVCPGNHDLKFSDDPADKNRPIEFPGPDAVKAYSDFYKEVFYLAPNDYLCCGKRFLMSNTIPVEIACLNSSALQQLKDAFQGHGFVGDKQMEYVESQMKWETDGNQPRAYRIVVLHHHLLPTTYSADPEPNYPYSVVLDAEALSRWITKNRVDLVLHGHMHQPFCARIARPIDVNHPELAWHEFDVLGMGSRGGKGELGEVRRNTVGFLEFDRDGVRASVHTVDPVNPSTEVWSVKLPYRNQ